MRYIISLIILTTSLCAQQGALVQIPAASAGASPAGSLGCIQLYLDATHFSACDNTNQNLFGAESTLPMFMQGYTGGRALFAYSAPDGQPGIGIEVAVGGTGTGDGIQLVTNANASFESFLYPKTAQDTWNFYTGNFSNGLVVPAFYNFWAGAPNLGGGGSVTTDWAFFADARGGLATNAYSFWSDEQGVFRIKADNTFDSVYQAIPALYNPQFTKYTPGAANYERIVEQWNGNVAEIGAEKGGTGTLRKVAWIGANQSIKSTLTPAVTNTGANTCGTTAATIAGNDNVFKVTVGATAGTSCTVTFATAFAVAPSCTVTNETTANLARATSSTSTVILAGTFVAGDTLAGFCMGR